MDIFIYRECVALQDPHCAWDSKQQNCTWVGNRRFPNPERYLQNVEWGKVAICNKIPPLIPQDRYKNVNPGTKKPIQIETVIIEKTKDLENGILIEIDEPNDISLDNNRINKHETGTYLLNYFIKNTVVLRR